MRGSREQIHGLGADRGVAQRTEPLYVPGQGSRVAGDIDHALRGHAGDHVHHLRGQALPGRIDHRQVGPDALPLQPDGQLGGVAALEAGFISQTVPAGVFPGVLHRLGHHLHPDEPLCPLGQGEADGADAAVQLHHRLPPGEGGKVQGAPVEYFRLRPVHLEEGGNGQPEAVAAQHLLQPVPAPEGAEAAAQDDIGFPGVDGQNHPRQQRRGGAQGLYQLLLMGELFPVGHKAAQDLPGGVGAQEQMAHQPFPCPLVVSRDTEMLHPALDRGAAGRVRLRLEQAVGNVYHLVAALPVVADGAVRHRELYLVAVTPRVFRAVYHGNGDVRPADAAQGLLHPLPLGLQLLGVGHMPELAAAAYAVPGAVRLRPRRGRLQQPLHTAPGGAVADVLDQHVHPLAPERALDEHRHALNAGDPLAAAGVPLDHGGVNLALRQHWRLPSAL